MASDTQQQAREILRAADERGWPTKHEQVLAAILAERDALAARVEQMRAALAWALGTNGDFREQRTTEGRYWWRGELAERAGLRWDGERWVDAALAGRS